MTALLLRPDRAPRRFAQPSRLEWRTTGVPYLAAADLAAIGEVLDRHARISRVERLERSQARLGGRAWGPVVLEIDGRVVGAPCRDNAWAIGPVASVGLRTYGRAAAFEARPVGLVVVIDDEPWLARETLAAIRRTLRPRRQSGLAFLASNWGVPSLVLALPVVASTVDPVAHEGPLTWAGMILAGVVLLWWLWWYHRAWLLRPFVAISAGERPIHCIDASHGRPRAPIGAPIPSGSARDDSRLDRGDLLA